METESDKDVSLLLQRCKAGDQCAQEELFAAINDRLRNLASRLMKSERADHTLQATGLVNEACLKVINHGAIASLENRRHLFATATQAMKQVLIDHARRRKADRRGGDRKREAMDIVLDRFEAEHRVDFSELEQALEKLKQHSQRQYQVVTLRFFAGLSIVDTAEILGCSKSTVESDWRWARAKLFAWLNE